MRENFRVSLHKLSKKEQYLTFEYEAFKILSCISFLWILSNKLNCSLSWCRAVSFTNTYLVLFFSCRFIFSQNLFAKTKVGFISAKVVQKQYDKLGLSVQPAFHFLLGNIGAEVFQKIKVHRLTEFWCSKRENDLFLGRVWPNFVRRVEWEN